ncbi:copper resistance protein B [Massilia suwonensis]|uniref:Copper resistance protein B n=2 Tax=Massilia suwonensis TaxID=648895 RepID=A0ABW0MG06_9BURK
MDHSQMDHSKMSQAKPRQSNARKPAAGQPVKDQSSMDHSGMDHSQMTMPVPAPAVPAPMSQQQPMQGMDHSQMDHSMPRQLDSTKPAGEQPAKDQSGMDYSQMTMPPSAQASSGAKPQQAMTHGTGEAMGSMQMGPMQGGKAPADARDPNAYGEGTRHAKLPGNAMMDDMPFGRVLIDSAELSRGDGEHGQNLDAEAWYGGDYNKVWLKAQGERTGGRLESLRTEALWDRAFAPFWSTQLGVRHDTGGGGSRNWLAAGVRGLAPYWFDVEATAYARPGGEFAARFDARYEVLFTQRLILEPQLEGNLYSRADRGRGTGTGLSNIEFGLRLRYEIRRQFAPYAGVTWNRRLGSTADLARARGEDATTFRAVAGLRLWY